MAVQIGYVDNHFQLLEAFVTFVTTNAELVSLGQNWQLLRSQTFPARNLHQPYYNPVYTEDMVVKYLKAPGLSNKDSIYLNILCYEAATAQLSNWWVTGNTGYDESLEFEYQPGIVRSYQTNPYPATAIFTLTNSRIDYWFVANGRRAIIIAKIGGDMYACHLGMFLPYGKPSEYPYPVLVSGTTNLITNGYTHSYLYNFWNSVENDDRSMFFVQNGIWAKLGALSDGAASPQLYAAVWPYDKVRTLTEDGNIMGNLDGSFTLLPLIIYSTSAGFVAEYGEIQGIYYLPGLGQTDITSEDTITVGSDTYLVIQNVDKISRNDFAALLLK